MQQLKHDENLVLMIGASNLPVSLVDNPGFVQYVRDIIPRILIPSRRKLTDNLLPSFIQKCMESTVITAFKSLASVSISFDLWMSRGCEDIFSVIAHRF